jgi:hypothetical protein
MRDHDDRDPKKPRRMRTIRKSRKGSNALESAELSPWQPTREDPGRDRHRRMNASDRLDLV